MVRLGTNERKWKIVIEDDGAGFPFAGRFSSHELEGLGKGPVVIKERVHLLAGELTIESKPGQRVTAGNRIFLRTRLEPEPRSYYG